MTAKIWRRSKRTYTEPTKPIIEEAAFMPAWLADVEAIAGIILCSLVIE
jgi:hypothetical protein